MIDSPETPRQPEKIVTQEEFDALRETVDAAEKLTLGGVNAYPGAIDKIILAKRVLVKLATRIDR